VPPQRVWLLSRFGLKTGIDFEHFGLKFTVAHNCHGKIFILAAKSISPRQNHFRHGKINFATAKSFYSRQNQFRHGKINFVTAKSISPRQNHFHSRQNNFG